MIVLGEFVIFRDYINKIVILHDSLQLVSVGV